MLLSRLTSVKYDAMLVKSQRSYRIKLMSFGFRYGIEHEVAFYRADGAFADFTNTSFTDFQQIIDLLPE